MSQVFAMNRAGVTHWRRPALFALLLFVLTLGGCESLRVGSDYDRAATFANYHSFSWLPRESYGVANPLAIERAQTAILNALEHKGYHYVSNRDEADFVVDFTIGSHERVDVRTYPAPYAWPWYGYGRYWWGYPYWGSEISVSRYREGTLAIDVFDAKTHRPVWHGWAEKELSHQDIVHSAESISKAVDAVLARFPPG